MLSIAASLPTLRRRVVLAHWALALEQELLTRIFEPCKEAMRRSCRDPPRPFREAIGVGLCRVVDPKRMRAIAAARNRANHPQPLEDAAAESAAIAAQGLLGRLCATARRK